jgi:hypothetical protein
MREPARPARAVAEYQNERGKVHAWLSNLGYISDVPATDRYEDLLVPLERFTDSEVSALAAATAQDYRATIAERDLVLALGLTLKARKLPLPSRFLAVMTEALHDLKDEIRTEDEA